MLASEKGTPRPDVDATAARLVAAARDFVPRIRDRARAMEQARRLDDDLVEDMEAAGLFSVVVPRRWGGAGLGPQELNTVVEIVATGDCSTAWVTGFDNLHNWFLCRFPMDVQEELYANRASVRCAAVFSPPGTAERVDGGYVVTGRWGYATGILHASHALVPAMVDDAFHWLIVARDDLDLSDDWDVASMVATGSVTIAADGVFVPEARGLPFGVLMSATDHPGAVHEEEVYRFPFSALTLATVSLYVGALDAAVGLAREGLQKSSGPASPARIERAALRTGWAHAYEAARVVRLVRDATAREAIAVARRGTPPTMEEEAHEQLHIQFIRQTVKRTLRDLVDVNGSSGYRSDNVLRRMASDIAMLSTHALNGEYDIAMDRHARWLLGLGWAPGDPGERLT
jgi:3-hydroxy-9,10-secoandrosta-1,3,5(10)-triene-9,17-dione monooxygenase